MNERVSEWNDLAARTQQSLVRGNQLSWHRQHVPPLPSPPRLQLYISTPSLRLSYRLRTSTAPSLTAHDQINN